MEKKNFYIKVFLIISLLVLLITFIFIGYKNFSNHRNTIIKQQQENLLLISKSISQSIEQSLQSNLYSLSLMSENPIIEDIFINEYSLNEYKLYEDLIISFYENNLDKIDNISLINKQGACIYQYPLSNMLNDKEINISTLNNVIKNKSPFITKEYESNYNEFSIDILYPIIINDKVEGFLLNTINLNKLYDNLIKPIRVGEKGYTMVKNREGVIIMHPVSNQIGIESLKVRTEKYPFLDWSELEELNNKQLTEKEGYHEYHSRWWQDDEIKLIKKIAAFTTFEIQNNSWIIAVQMDYSEIEQPIKGTLIYILTLVTIITIFLIIIFYIIFTIEKRRKELELETKYLKELNKTWDKLIKSESRLRHTQKLETIGLLTSGITHEFKNLLSPILGYSELLLESNKDNDEVIDNVIEIKKSALKSKEFIDQILSFSRKDTVNNKYEVIEIEDIIKESLKLVKLIQPKNINIELNSNYNGTVIGDKNQLEQVFVNLYTNSYYAMKGNNGKLQINIEDVFVDNNFCDLNEGKYIKIQIKDSGIGIKKEILNKIFDPFFTTKKSEEGTGLGLSVVLGIIKEHKGYIDIESTENIGTTVNIYLPIYDNKKK